MWKKSTNQGKSNLMEKKRKCIYGKNKKAYQKPEMAFIDTEKHTVSGSPEMVEHLLPKFDQIIERLAEEGMALELYSNSYPLKREIT